MTNTVESRLANLPTKTAMPFRQLLSAGQVTEDAIHSVLDAGEITGDNSKLIGFAVGFLHLRAQGVPVPDVIRMAKAQKRRINLSWGAKRWKEEHDRLSRAEALQKMAQENVHYDVSKYEKHLPEHFSGYLIRTSRRLGMEGLRQRHCVASYDGRLRNGNCAIAAIFVDKRRWTVQLGLADNADAPLRICQIKSKHNAVPPASVRQKIFDLLGVDLKKSSAATAIHTEREYLYMENLRRILPILAAQSITKVTVYFEGSGDSGCIESIGYEPCDKEGAVKNLPVEHVSTASFIEDGEWRRLTTPEQSTLNEALDALTYDYLEETGVDWYNNEGGYGELIIDVTQGTVSIEVNVRTTHTDTEYSAELDIETGEDIEA